MQTTIADILLTALLAAAVMIDLKTKNIPNSITIFGAAVAFALNGISGGMQGIGFSAAGFAAGIALMLIPFLFGGIGGGDVKLLAAVGAFKGTAFVAVAFLGAAVAGGVIALSVAVAGKQLRPTLRNMKAIVVMLLLRTNPRLIIDMEENGKGVFPYAGAIAAGAAAAFFILPRITG
jgi:prepilin peptidase CpaA